MRRGADPTEHQLLLGGNVQQRRTSRRRVRKDEGRERTKEERRGEGGRKG